MIRSLNEIAKPHQDSGVCATALPLSLGFADGPCLGLSTNRREIQGEKKKKVKISKADYNTVTLKGARKDEQILLYCSEIPVRSVLPVSLGFAGGPGLGSSVDKQS